MRGVSRRAPPAEMLKAPGYRSILLDLSREQLPDEALSGADVLFHAAGANAGAGNDERFFLTANEAVTVNVLKSCAGRIARIVHASSQVVYGDVGSVAIDENYPLFGDSAYACSKVNSEHWLKWFQMSRGGVAVSLRLTGFIEGGGAVDFFADKALRNEPIEVLSMGAVRRDYLAADDGLRAFLAAADKRYSGDCLEAYNIGSGEMLSALDLAKLVCRELGSKSAVIPVARPASRKDTVFNIDKARSHLGFSPAPLADAVRTYLQGRVVAR